MATRLVGIAENLSLWAGSIVQFLLYSVRRLYKAWAKRNSTSEKKKLVIFEIYSVNLIARKCKRGQTLQK